MDVKILKVEINIGIVLYALCNAEIIADTDHYRIGYQTCSTETPLEIKSLEAHICVTFAEHIAAYTDIETRTRKS